MIHAPHYTIKLTNGTEIPLLFNSWMLKKYSEAKGMDLHELLRHIQTVISGKGGFVADDIPIIFLSAHESFQRFNRLPFQADEITAHEWIDDLGGFINGLTPFMEIFVVMLSKILNIDESLLKAKTVKEGEEEVVQKKSSSPIEAVSS